MSVRGDEPEDVRINVGEFDPVLGRSYHELAMEGRSFHRSQSQGAARNKGVRHSRLRLVKSSVEGLPGGGIFHGTIHKLGDMAALERELGSDFSELAERIESLRRSADLRRPADLLPELVDALKLTRQIRSKSTNENVRFLLERKEQDFHEAADWRPAWFSMLWLRRHGHSGTGIHPIHCCLQRGAV